MSFDYREMSAPFELKGTSNKAILLIHGFLATPYIMQSLGKTFQQAGYNVKALCLKGHGTTFADLRKASYQDWQNAVDEAVQSLQSTHEEVIIVGFSLGCILGLIAAFKFKIEKLILLSPAFKISWAGQLFNYLSILHLDWLLPDLHCTQSEEINLGSYRRFSPHGVAQVQKAINQYHNLLAKTTYLPKIYVACSVEDATVKFAGVLDAIKIYQQGSHFRIYTQNPAELPEDMDGNDIKIIDIRQFDHIQAFSHVALPVAPEDPYFGKNGAYYGILADTIQLGEPTLKDRGKEIKRLTYNPDFAAMSQDMLAWLGSTHGRT